MKSCIYLFTLILIGLLLPITCLGGECYSYGVKYGYCAYRSMNGLPCDAEDEIVIPVHCRGVEETQDGIEAGVKKADSEIKRGLQHKQNDSNAKKGKK